MNSSILNVSWQEVENACLDIAHQIKQAKFKPHIVVPVLWGGVIPSRIIMDIMDFDRTKCIPVSTMSYKDCQATEEITVDIPNKLSQETQCYSNDILIIEEIIDSGRTIERIIQEIVITCPRITIEKIRVATLFTRAIEKNERYWKPLGVVHTCNIYRHKEINDEWVIFPWDKQEYMRSNQ